MCARARAQAFTEPCLSLSQTDGQAAVCRSPRAYLLFPRSADATCAMKGGLWRPRSGQACQTLFTAAFASLCISPCFKPAHYCHSCHGDLGSRFQSAPMTAVFIVRYFLVKVGVSFLELSRLHTSQATTWGRCGWNELTGWPCCGVHSCTGLELHLQHLRRRITAPKSSENERNQLALAAISLQT